MGPIGRLFFFDQWECIISSIVPSMHKKDKGSSLVLIFLPPFCIKTKRRSRPRGTRALWKNNHLMTPQKMPLQTIPNHFPLQKHKKWLYSEHVRQFDHQQTSVFIFLPILWLHSPSVLRAYLLTTQINLSFIRQSMKYFSLLADFWKHIHAILFLDWSKDWLNQKESSHFA